MQFDYDDDQREFRAVLVQLLATHAGIDRVRAIAESDGIDRELWTLLCTEMAAPALHLPEEVGGAGFTLVETAILAQELGRALAPVPLVATAIVTEAIMQTTAADEAEQLLAPILAGDQVVSAPFTALAETAGHVRVDDNGTLTGTVGFVPHASQADEILVAATSAGGDVSIHLVPTRADGVSFDDGESLDLTRAGAVMHLSGAHARRLGSGAVAAETLGRIDAVGQTLVAADMVGAAQQTLAVAVEHAKTRRQFNRPIGSFQAVKHLCAEASITIEMAHPVADFAAMTYGDDEFARNALLAKYQASDALTLAAGNSIQVHGGMGFTWEATPHLYYRRALALAQAYGDANATLLAVYRNSAA